jgi:hypothetical protein
VDHLGGVDDSGLWQVDVLLAAGIKALVTCPGQHVRNNDPAVGS